MLQANELYMYRDIKIDYHRAAARGKLTKALDLGPIKQSNNTSLLVG